MINPSADGYASVKRFQLCSNFSVYFGIEKF